MTTVSLVTVGDDTLEAARTDDGAVLVVIRRVCEALGIDAATQREQLQRAAWSKDKVRELAVVDALGRERRALAIELDALPMWLSGIDTGRVSEATRPKLVRFQIEARTVLAEHFGVGRAVPTQPPSGGLSRSGGPVAMAPTRPAPSALEQLAALEQMNQVVGGLLAVVRKGAEDLAVVAARVDATEAALAAANARADEALAVVDSIKKQSVTFRESARAIKNTAAYISRAIRRHCGRSEGQWRAVYGAARDELGLARSPVVNTSAAPGEPVKTKKPKPIGECIRTASQVLTYARVAHKHGVPGCDVATINRLLNSDDDANVVDAETQAIQ